MQIVDVGVQFLDTVIDMPVIMHVVFVVLKTVEVPQLQFLDKVVDVFFVQFFDGCGRPCARAEACHRPVVLHRQGFWSRQRRTLSGGIQVQFCFTETGLAVQTVQNTGDSMAQFWDGR